MKKYELRIEVPVLTVRVYDLEKEFSSDAERDAYLKEIVQSGQIPDEWDENGYSELSIESESTPPPIAGSHRFPGVAAGVLKDGWIFSPVANEEPGNQQAFFWEAHGDNLVAFPVIGYQSVGRNIIIARPIDHKFHNNIILDGCPIENSLFEYGGQTWEILFVFKHPE